MYISSGWLLGTVLYMLYGHLYVYVCYESQNSIMYRVTVIGALKIVMYSVLEVFTHKDLLLGFIQFVGIVYSIRLRLFVQLVIDCHVRNHVCFI